MKILIIGSGGREHALAWKAAQSSQTEVVFVAPGNSGTATESKLHNVNIAPDDIIGLRDFAKKEAINLTIIGPETPLVNGIVDKFKQVGLACFGPSKSAAMVEGSKSFSKDFMQRHHIPTAEYNVFTDSNAAKDYVKNTGTPIVIKADGLAAGKGVIIANTLEEAHIAIEAMLLHNKFGNAGKHIIIEEFITGEEASFIVMSDGKNILPLASSQDHKARDDGNQGPNTGGMGAYSPAPVVTADIHQRIMSEVIQPTIKGMAAEGSPYIGFLYAGLIITADGTPKVLEFNCRLGDPETQAVMMRLQSDLPELCNAALADQLDRVTAEWDPCAAIGIVLAARGYPDPPQKGDIISGLDHQYPDAVKIFHAGTRQQGNHIVTAGGRVLCVTALGTDIVQARQSAYDNVSRINWEGMFYRKDIAYRAINKTS